MNRKLTTELTVTVGKYKCYWLSYKNEVCLIAGSKGDKLHRALRLKHGDKVKLTLEKVKK